MGADHNIEQVTAIFEAFGRVDVPFMLDQLAPDNRGPSNLDAFCSLSGAILRSMPINAPLIHGEREGLLVFLAHQRNAVRNATYGLREDQARLTPTPSGLSLGGLVKHLADAEQGWTDRILGVPPSDTALADYMASFSLSDDETLAGVLLRYEETSARTDAVVAHVDDLGHRVLLPEAPWLPDPQRCTARWTLFHLVEETARHAGHADIIREALDGALSGPLMAAAEQWPDDGWIKPWRQLS